MSSNLINHIKLLLSLIKLIFTAQEFSSVNWNLKNYCIIQNPFLAWNNQFYLFPKRSSHKVFLLCSSHFEMFTGNGTLRKETQESNVNFLWIGTRRNFLGMICRDKKSGKTWNWRSLRGNETISQEKF